MSKGYAFNEVLELIDSYQMEDVLELVRSYGFYDCPGCGLWFKDEDYDKDYPFDDEEPCKAHNLPCNKVFSNDGKFYVCLESRDKNHFHLDLSKIKCREINKSDSVYIDDNNELKVKIE